MTPPTPPTPTPTPTPTLSDSLPTLIARHANTDAATHRALCQLAAAVSAADQVCRTWWWGTPR